MLGRCTDLSAGDNSEFKQPPRPPALQSLKLSGNGFYIVHLSDNLKFSIHITIMLKVSPSCGSVIVLSISGCCNTNVIDGQVITEICFPQC